MRMRSVWALCGLIVMSACSGIEIYGTADNYAPRVPYAIEVEMPPNALFISEQFRKGRSQTGTDAHPGLDVWGPLLTPILAAGDGIVSESYYDPAFGNRVTVEHARLDNGDFRETRYFHLKESLVRVGQRVSRGEEIGKMGATGALGMLVHLHYEVREGPTKSRLEEKDPNLFWVRGIGKVTCFDPIYNTPEYRDLYTYPVKCK
ncbi:MAG: M23 family metallopeptidase [Pseudomonadota bacterium]